MKTLKKVLLTLILFLFVTSLSAYTKEEIFQKSFIPGYGQWSADQKVKGAAFFGLVLYGLYQAGSGINKMDAASQSYGGKPNIFMPYIVMNVINPGTTYAASNGSGYTYNGVYYSTPATDSECQTVFYTPACTYKKTDKKSENLLFASLIYNTDKQAYDKQKSKKNKATT